MATDTPQSWKLYIYSLNFFNTGPVDVFLPVDGHIDGKICLIDRKFASIDRKFLTIDVLFLLMFFLAVDGIFSTLERLRNDLMAPGFLRVGAHHLVYGL